MRKDEKNEHIAKFENALLSVAPEYFGIPILGGSKQLSERAFAYELYHQLRKSYNGKNWYANGELMKGLTFLPDYKSNEKLIPDLIIHHHENVSNNIIAVEIKTNPKVTGTELIKDLEKLEKYTRPGDRFLNFSIGILLITNSNFRLKLAKMNSKNRERIIELMNYTRIGIWNIEQPIPLTEYGDEMRLNPDCLDIIRKHNITESTKHNNV